MGKFTLLLLLFSMLIYLDNNIMAVFIHFCSIIAIIEKFWYNHTIINGNNREEKVWNYTIYCL